MEAFHSQASGVRMLIVIVFCLFVLFLLSMGLSLAELSIGCLQLSRRLHVSGSVDYSSNRRATTIPVYLIVGGILGLLSSLTNGACLRGSSSRRQQQRQRRNCRLKLKACVYSIGGLAHLFSVAWLAVGFYWVYSSSPSSDDGNNNGLSAFVFNVTAVSATTTAAAITDTWSSEAGEAMPLLWIRLTVCLLEFTIVVAMLACCRSPGEQRQDKGSSAAAAAEGASVDPAVEEGSKFVALVVSDGDVAFGDQN